MVNCANSRMYTRLRNFMVICVLGIALAACESTGENRSGASSGGAGGTNGGGNVTPPPAGFVPADFETAEYNRQYGLAQVNASSAYARGASGNGVTVAVIDTGIDTDHPELAGRISSRSIDIIGGSRSSVEDTDGHGTAVAGIVAGLKNGRGTHGIAFGSQVLAIRADEIDNGQCVDQCGFFSSDVVSAIKYAVANGAKVINLSISGPGLIGNNYEDAINNAGNNGVVVVAAAGNSSGLSPEAPASFASSGRSVGNMLAVGAVDENNDIASFSNRAGTRNSHYVVAAGVDVRSLGVGGGEVLATGTSFSAPHVAGAAALLFDLFPNLSAQDVVDLLRETAVDLGFRGNDLVYGRGLIDLDAAIAPQGQAAVPQGNSADEPGQPLSMSMVRFSPAFGDGPARAAGIAGMSEVLFLDDYGRGYRADLSRMFQRQADAGFLDGFVAGQNGTFHTALDLTGPAQSFGLKDMAVNAWNLTGYGNIAFGNANDGRSLMGGIAEREAFSFSAGVPTGLQNQSLRLSFATGAAVDGQGGEQDLLQQSGALSLFAAGSHAMQPMTGLMDSPLSYRARWTGWNAFHLDASYITDDQDRFKGFATDERAVQKSVGLSYFDSYCIDCAATPLERGLAVTVSSLREQNRLLGSAGAGLSALSGVAETTFVGLSGYYDLALPMIGAVTLFGTWQTSHTEQTDSGTTLLRDWGTVRAGGFAFGGIAKNVFELNDQLGLIIAQPYRVQSGAATFNVPKSRTEKGIILYDRREASFAPSGRELLVELGYTKPWVRKSGQDGVMSLHLFGRQEPGHNAAAAPDIGIAARASVQF